MDPLRIEIRGHVLIATLNRPDRLNALDSTLIAALRSAWADDDRLLGIRCIVITGEGRAFCSGADMTLLSSDRADAPESAREELSFVPAGQVDCPVIVAVNGVCAGAGLHFVADADIAIASEDAEFLDPHVTVGQVSALEPLTLLPKVRAQSIARMVLLGKRERIAAAQALESGLVSEVVPRHQLRIRALELAGIIAENSPAAVAVSRRMLRSYEERLLEGLLDEGWAAIRAHWAHPDSKEGPAAFTEKRNPRWAEE